MDDKKNKYNVKLDDSLSENPVASAHECTGIAPTEIRDESQAESYTQIYDIPIANVKRKKNK